MTEQESSTSPSPSRGVMRLRRRALAGGIVVGLAILLCAYAAVDAPAPSASTSGVAGEASDADGSRAEVPLFDGMGMHGRKVTTASAESQRYFDQGLNLMYGFNHDEAIRSFRRAAELDPACAMAWWGIALANGPHINNPLVDTEHARAAWAALTRARATAAGGSPVERALIEALGRRYADPQPENRQPLDQAYAEAMRGAWRAHPGDSDVGALFAEALMDLRPWDQWTAEGVPQPGTEEVLATLEAVLRASPHHPLANHLYIHAVEASPHPEKADAAADRLRRLMPGVGHMVHMPSHVDVRRGRWPQAIAANERAIAADLGYREVVPRQGFYLIYMAHNRHMLAYAAMMTGESERSIGEIRAMIAEMPADWMRENAAFVDGFLAMPFEALVRFGRWEEILAEPEPAAHFPIARALRHAARGVAQAARDRLPEARAEQRAFQEARAQVPEGAFFGNNSAGAILDVAEHLLSGEILFRAGQVEEGLAELRRAVESEDLLRYNEPPDWIQPVRHALGASLMQAGKFAEAEQVYRQDLGRLPDNGWSTFGLARSLRLQGKESEAAVVDKRFREVWKTADVQIPSSCFCQPGI